MNKATAFNALKLIGVLLFAYILYKIDRTALLKALAQTDIALLLASFPLIFVIYWLKTLRWHHLVQTLGIKPKFAESWQVYNLGLFLGIITPAKLGEFGRAAYLKKHGVNGPKGIGIVFIDRLADVIAILLVGIAAIGILISWMFSLILLIVTLIITSLSLFAFFQLPVVKMARAFMPPLRTLVRWKTVSRITLFTFAGWAIYFGWAILLARSLGITVEPTILVACFTLTGILSMLPIAPSGLGTRDAALIALLAPFSVTAAQSVALAQLMFISIIVSSILGMYYWFTFSQPRVD